MPPSPHLEVWVEHPVGEATHADPDAFEHTVASQLVHDQGALHLVMVVIRVIMRMVMMMMMLFIVCLGDRKSHLAGLFVGVWHKATHKVGLAVVQGGLHKNNYSILNVR